MTYDLYAPQNNFGQTDTFNFGFDFGGGFDLGGGGSFDYGGYNFGGGSTSDFFSYIIPASSGAADSQPNPIMDILGSAWKSFKEADPKVQSTLLSLGGSFLAGAMGAKRADQLAKNSKMTAEASMMNAQSAAKLADSKVAARSDMSKTTFGKPRAGGIMSLPYKNKLAERQANPGGSGLIGAA